VLGCAVYNCNECFAFVRRQAQLTFRKDRALISALGIEASNGSRLVSESIGSEAALSAICAMLCAALPGFVTPLVDGDEYRDCERSLNRGELKSLLLLAFSMLEFYYYPFALFCQVLKKIGRFSCFLLSCA